jgi:protein TonB
VARRAPGEPAEPVPADVAPGPEANDTARRAVAADPGSDGTLAPVATVSRALTVAPNTPRAETRTGARSAFAPTRSAPAPVETAQLQAAMRAESVPPDRPVAQTPPERSSATEPEQATAVLPEDTIAGQAPDTAAVFRSLRPAMRSEAVAREARPAPRPQRQAERSERAERPSGGGGAQRNARAGETTGSERATARRSGAGGQSQAAGNAAASNYPGLVMRALSRVRKPNVRARGAATVSFSIASSGGLASVRVVRSSGSAALDRAALRLVQGAAPFPRPPSGARRSFSIQIEGR